MIFIKLLTSKRNHNNRNEHFQNTFHLAMTESTACPIMIGIVQGVNYLHSINITHRDLKPENIMLTRDGIPKLIDFGFARNFSKEVYTMRTLCGSHAYCSPEFLRKRGYFPRQHDVWALGVILYVMLNGTLPYRLTMIRI